MSYDLKKKFDLNIRIIPPKIDTSQLIFSLCTIVTVFVSIFFILYIFYAAWPVFKNEGINFILGSTWDYKNEVYGILPLIIGTIVLTIVTMLIACPISIFTAIYLAEFAPKLISSIMRSTIDLLVGIPSVVYGIFGFFMLKNIFGNYIDPFLNNVLGFIPFFNNVHPGEGTGILLASTILAIMILPTIIAIAEESLRSVNQEYKEASYALGSNHWETIKKIILPTALPGILTGVILGMMRAMGETMAVVMLIGTAWHIPTSIMDYAYPMTSKIVNDIPYYMAFDGPRSALLGIAAVLFILELLFIGVVKLVGGTRKWE
jgi:phosphate transport system permease protein